MEHLSQIIYISNEGNTLKYTGSGLKIFQDFAKYFFKTEVKNK